jgi:hypothetical protein
MTVGVGGRDSTRRRNAHPYGHFELGFRFTDMGFYDTIILTITNGEFYGMVLDTIELIIDMKLRMVQFVAKICKKHE